MTPLFKTPLQLIGAVQHYDWGKLGAQSLVARLAQYQNGGAPCAELWFGAHSKNPAMVCWGERRYKLDELIAKHPENILGPRVIAQFGNSLPFLFKIISVRTALSIQAHPDRDRARLLHLRDPVHYPDPNHKPELAVALTPVDLLYGFRDPERLLAILGQVPELRGLVGSGWEHTASSRSESLGREMFRKLLRQPVTLVNRHAQDLFRRLEQSRELTAEDRIVLSLKPRFPQGDRGLFCIYLLNLERMQPGDGMFVEPNVLHAYLTGDLIECMANSDNVVRVGLTSKFQDVDTMFDLLVSKDAQFKPILPIATGGEGFQAYRVPVSEFCLEYLAGRDMSVAVTPRGGVEVIFSLDGTGTFFGAKWELPIAAGNAFIIPAELGEWGIKHFSGHLYRVFVP